MTIMILRGMMITVSLNKLFPDDSKMYHSGNYSRRNFFLKIKSIRNLVENLENIFDIKNKNKTPKRTVHEQNDGKIFAICCTGTSTLYSGKFFFFFFIIHITSYCVNLSKNMDENTGEIN
jgi:hypothetical protein